MASVSGSVRLATWNVWWRFGDWRSRQAAIARTLEQLRADIVGLQEAWTGQVEELARALGLHCVRHAAPTATHWQRRRPDSADIDVCNAVLSRWPIVDVQTIELSEPAAAAGRTALLARIDTPQGPVELCCTQLSSSVQDGSAIRSRQVHRLSRWLATRAEASTPQIIVGDLDAEPDADEMRRLGGHLTEPFTPGQIWVDAWRYRDDHDPGYTWRRDNPYVRATGEPWARVDYILLAPSSQGLPGVDRVDLFATEAVDGVYASDHAGVVADLRLPYADGEPATG